MAGKMWDKEKARLSPSFPFPAAELKAKEANMRELVSLAEAREARAKREIAALLAERAEVFDTDTARGARCAAAQEQGPAQEEGDGAMAQPAAEPAGESGDAAEGLVEPASASFDDQSTAAEEQAAQEGPLASDGGETAAGTDDDGADAATEQEGAREGTATPRAAAASAEAEGAASAPTAASPEADVERRLRERQLAFAEARRRKAAAKEKFSKLSQVCVAADQVSGGLVRLGSKSA